MKPNIKTVVIVCALPLFVASLGLNFILLSGRCDDKVDSLDVLVHNVVLVANAAEISDGTTMQAKAALDHRLQDALSKVRNEVDLAFVNLGLRNGELRILTDGNDLFLSLAAKRPVDGIGSVYTIVGVRCESFLKTNAEAEKGDAHDLTPPPTPDSR